MGRACALLLLALCSSVACGTSGVTPGATSAFAGTPCAPGDQDAFVYRPARLSVLAPCLRMSGTIVASSTEADGDVHLQVRLDDRFRALLRPGNDFEEGNLIVEPVCQIPPIQADAMRTCALDPAPLAARPRVGDHVWLEGRYVIDTQHHDWAELHPLYRWEPAAP